MRSSVAAGYALVACLLFATAVAESAPLRVEGTVVDPQGTPIPFVRLSIAGAATAPLTTTVFSVQDGKFSARLREADSERIKVTSFRIGWQESARELTRQAGVMQLKLTLTPIECRRSSSGVRLDPGETRRARFPYPYKRMCGLPPTGRRTGQTFCVQPRGTDAGNPNGGVGCDRAVHAQPGTADGAGRRTASALGADRNRR